ncbi:hypothetical protein TTHERM_00077579 (macronuclear) [Tetrahymena thermophila SB210]|uniref:Uncharacterized protein n=1 Tax=Tetrahymena thermophila (strain SB210) TaxID=312017 RepID=A4VDY3_TETTS|nr:hypothetical protein TTHERM_00077579 [Tetrahymena thermophila SB210]EDK31735.2 hypothetical protein TTHERM_00077579 [Tetrahymena thermophila SB210]|eukprot:XP_001471342.2 hypothetical protein TTHERM_00077579 [Tetrahymena thermophila SB210]
MEIYHGVNNIVKIGKDLMRTYLKYLENQSYVTSKTGRRYYVIGCEVMINENKSKVEKYKYFFFDKGEVIQQYRLKDYDDLILLFKFDNQWFVTLWKIHENEIYLIDYKTNSEDKFGNVIQIVKDFHKKFFDFQIPGKGIIILPDNFSYKVQESKNDDCGDLCMAFLYFYIIGSLIIEIKLTPPKRANFAISFGWLLLKIYHEQEYNFKKNINKPQTMLLQISKHAPSSQSNLEEEIQQRDLQELQEGFGFREIFMGDGINKLPKNEIGNTENKVIRKTPIPNIEDYPVSEETLEMNDQSEEEFRKKIIFVASQKDREELDENYKRQSAKNYQTKQILNSFEIEPYKFNNRSTAQDQIIQEKPAFNQQERRSANNKLNQDSFQLKPESIWQHLSSQPDQLEQSSIRKKVENKSQLQKAGDQILSQSSYLSSNQMSQQQVSPIMKQVQQQNQQSKKIAQLSKQEFEKQKKELEDKLVQINNQFIKKQDIIDILDDIRKDVNFEMKIEMRKLAEDIKLEQEKKAIEDELRKKHFEDYFKFLLAYYYENDIQQYYQLLEEYNNRLRQFAVSNLPDNLFLQQVNQPQMNNNSSLSTAGQTLPFGSNINSQHTPQKGYKSSEQLYEGYFNRGSMKYASNLGNKPQAWSIEPKYLDNDNNFNNGNIKVPKNAEFRSPGFNGFAISPEKSEKYKNRIQKYLFDDLQFGQARADYLKEIRKKQEQKERIQHEQIEDLTRINDRGLKLFGGDYYKQQKIQNQIEQERKYQQLLLNPGGQQQNQRKSQLFSKYNSQTNLQDLYNMNQDLYTSKTNNNVNTVSSGYKTFVPTSNSIKITNNSYQNF